MRRVAAQLIGAVLVLGGTFALVVGIVLIAVFGLDGVTSTGPVRAVTSSSALVADPRGVDAGLPRTVDLTSLELQVSDVNRGEVFLGVGPAQDVLAYLSGSPYDVARGLDGRARDLEPVTVAGTGAPSPPGAQSFWTQQVTGTGNQSLTVVVAGRDELVVVMNADASNPIDVRLEASVEAAWIGLAGVAGIAGGGALLLLGLWLLVARRQDAGRLRSGDNAPHASVAESSSPPSAWGPPIAANDIASPSGPTPSPSASEGDREILLPEPRAPLTIDVAALVAAHTPRRAAGPERPPQEPVA